MADRTEAQLLDLLQDFTAIPALLSVFLEGDFTTVIDAFIAETHTGDDRPENAAMRTAIQTWVNGVAAQYAALAPVADSMLPAIGRLVGAPSLTDRGIVLDHLQKYMIDNSKVILERGVARTPGSPTGAGAGILLVHATDLNGDNIDVGHLGSITFRCSQDHSQGAQAGRERFRIVGTPAGRNYAWQEGSAQVGQYNYRYGMHGLAADLGPGIQIVTPATQISAFSSGAGNLIPNGNFGSGAEENWTFPANWGLSEVNPINGVSSVELTANGAAEADIRPNSMQNGRPYGLSIKVQPVNGGSGTVTGTLTVAIMDRDEGVTHLTQNITIGSLSVNDKTVVNLGTFILPFTAKDLKVVVTMASIGGTAGAPTVKFDDLVGSPLSFMDGLLFSIHDGTTLDANGNAVGRFKFGDTFPVAVADDNPGGLIQTFLLNRLWSRYLASADTASTNWEDPTLP